MENKILTEKDKAISVMKWTIKKNLSVSVAYWILLFLSFPVIEIGWMILSNASMEQNYVDLVKDEMVNFPLNAFALVAIIFSIVITINAFSYMHNKRSVDLFGSLPMSRRAMFFARYCSAIFLCVVPIIVIGLVGAVLTFKWSTMVLVFKLLGMIIVPIIGNISFISFISVCCGTAGDVLISYALINIIYPICISVCSGFPASVIPGISMDAVPASVYTMLCPIAAPFVGIGSDEKLFLNIWWLAFSVVLMAGCYVLCKKRKAEIAQNPFAFVAVEIVIKFVACFTVGFGFGWMVSYLGLAYNSVMAQYVWFVAGFVIAIMTANILIHLVFHRGVSQFVKSLPGCVVVFATGMVFLLVVTSGLFGYDQRIPDVEDIDTVYVKTSDMDSFIINGKDLLEKKYSDKETIEDVVGMHGDIIENINKIKYKGLYPIEYDGSAYSDGVVTKGYVESEVEITYKLKNGKTVKRYYMDTYGEVKIPESIDRTEKDKIELLYQVPIKYIDSISLYVSDGKGVNDEKSYVLDSLNEAFDKKKVQKLLDALKKDISEQGIYNKSNDKAIKYSIEIYYDDGEGWYRPIELSIPDTYTNTLRALSETGYGNIKYYTLYTDAPLYNNSSDMKYYISDREIYFKVPDNWDENLEIRCVPYVEEVMSYMVSLDDELTKCEKVSDGIYKYSVPELTEGPQHYEADNFDVTKVMFYQYSDRVFNCTGCIEFEEGKNLLEVKNTQFDWENVYEYEPMCEYKWKKWGR